MLHTDICIAGAGIIGLSLALELQAQGLNVIVVEAGTPLREASTAAAGMLAANDPHNPAQLSELSHLSISLYPEFLARVQHLGGIGGIAVPFQTSRTLQQMPGSSQDTRNGTPASLSSAQLHSLLLDLRGGAASFRSWDDTDSSLSSGFTMLEEHSLDPRQLAAALLAAVKATSIQLFTETSVVSSISSANSVTVFTSNDTIAAAHLIDCTGSWVNDPSCQVKPIKGQMLAVVTPPELPLQAVVRTGEIYIVPRTTGPNAGRSIIGATIEDVGFDKTVHPHQIADLRRQAAELLPQLAQAPMLESWSGLRPATPDHLPLLGAHPTKPRHWIAAGHYRNGILLAPATAHVMAQLLLDRSPSVSLDAYSPGRASLLKASHL